MYQQKVETIARYIHIAGKLERTLRLIIKGFPN
jgi:hypothetical protein